ncbi:GyrI-like domain-containing protein [Xanthovirga aplysinae]|uniref:GyrI-like domain-containing protein n=1 Tax=Xanthovirga aplysinae TaxID=2529853 RepID=UPI0012BBB97E|nr:GyrI-like domain-containing protein [Xanthovirga aplysinae]MTI31998.1 AraC family transcriptional regulator [Xanthovirga aplysinae]
MEHVKIEPFKIIGISVRTSNQNEQAEKDIGKLWEKFMTEEIINKIPNKTDKTIYSIYTDYEGDYTQPYSTLIGCKVENLDMIPKGMIGKAFDGGNYVKFSPKGDLTKGLIINEWSKIWKLDIDRVYSADFEVYGEKAQNPVNAEVDIFVATKH